MGYNEQVLEKINAMEQRADERRALWQVVVQSFESEGADGVSNELAKQMDSICNRFRMIIRKLEDKL